MLGHPLRVAEGADQRTIQPAGMPEIDIFHARLGVQLGFLQATVPWPGFPAKSNAGPPGGIDVFSGRIFFDSAVWPFIHAGLVAIPKESDLYTLFWVRLRRVRKSSRDFFTSLAWLCSWSPAPDAGGVIDLLTGYNRNRSSVI